MLRITEKSRTDSTVTYAVEGSIDDSGLREISALCSQAVSEGLEPVLDLSLVSFVGRDSVKGFRSLHNHSVRMINCSPFLAEQLKLNGCNA